MGWAGHDPEGWDSCCRNAATRWLEDQMREWWGPERLLKLSTPGWDIDEMMEMLQSEHPAVFAAMLQSGADRYLTEAEADFFTAKITGMEVNHADR